MKKIVTIFILLVTISSVFAQKNYPILTLDECGATTLIYDEPIMAVVENIDDVPNLAFYDLEKKEVMQKFSAKLPENPVYHLVPCDDGFLYFVTIKKNPEQGPPLFDAIYSFDYKTDKIAKVYTEKESVYVPKIAAVRDKLVLSTSSFKKQPRIFNLKTGEFEPFSSDENLRMLCAADSHNSYVVMNVNELNDDGTVPVYVMDENGNLTDAIGVYDSRMIASTNSDENHMPGFTITNADYNWVKQAHDNSGFPLSGFAIAMHPGLAKKYNQTNHLFDIREIVAANESYMAVEGNGRLWVYNTKELNTTKPQTVSDEDMEAMTNYLDEKISYIKTPMQSSALNQVFDAKFFSITEKEKMGDSGYSESSFLAFAKSREYDVLMDKSGLKDLLAPSFQLSSEQDASLFQDALNALYPPDTFAKKHVQYFKKDSDWCFVRDESFGDKKGFVVSVNSQKKIEKIEYKDKM